ncbi:Ig-like domain-containing protein [Flavobacterium sp.]
MCPMIIDTNPDKAATNIPLNQVITVTFNEEMNPSI